MDLLKRIPKMDELLALPELAGLREQRGHAVVRAAARAVLEELRAAILRGEAEAIPENGALIAQVTARVARDGLPSLRRVVNATGVLLHTNLGRAPLAEAAVRAAAEVAAGYSTLEYNARAGERGSRHDHVAALLCALTGAEDAMVVNNNAGAVLLLLAAIAQGKEVIVSRGELVEIGGSFRIPDIMSLSGAALREVGTTNRTHLADYAAAIGEQTGALMKAHTSNFKIIGFTHEVGLDALISLGRERGIPVVYDLGGGYLLPMEGFAAPEEPCVAGCVAQGVDLLCFSGDKLLGGPQAGILLGSKQYIAKLKKHPLARALRVDKMTLAALEATLALYRDPALAAREIPVLHMMRAPAEALREKAERLAARLDFLTPAPVLAEEVGQIGGGTAPALALPSVAVAIAPGARGADWLEASLRAQEPPIVARIAHDRLLLDVRTLDEADFPHIAAALRAAWEADA